MESGNGSKLNNYFGAKGERGRFQLLPSGRWNLVLNLSTRCTWFRVKFFYSDNIYCGLLYIKFLYEETHSWESTITQYNGSGPLANSYLNKAKFYIGQYRLKILNGCT